MSDVRYKVCDGCGHRFEGERPGVQVTRLHGIPPKEGLDGKYDWCDACTAIAFRAVREAQGNYA